jgi:hypothetical protein
MRVFECRQQLLATEAIAEHDGHRNRARRVVNLDHRRADAALGQRELIRQSLPCGWKGGAARANAIRRRWSLSWPGSFVHATITSISAADVRRTSRSAGLSSVVMASTIPARSAALYQDETGCSSRFCAHKRRAGKS